MQLALYTNDRLVTGRSHFVILTVGSVPIMVTWLLCFIVRAPSSCLTIHQKEPLWVEPPGEGAWTLAHRRKATLQKYLTHLQSFSEGSSTLFFTHVRRTGGSSLEDHVFIPFANTTGRPPLNCLENFHARFYAINDTSDLQTFREQIRNSSLQYRHCPYGLHTFLTHDNYAYMTLLRQPVARMKVSGMQYANCMPYQGPYYPNQCLLLQQWTVMVAVLPESKPDLLPLLSSA